MFNKTPEYSIIKTDLIARNIFDKWAIFECYVDSVATFGLLDNGIYYQFNVICDDDFSRDIQVLDILELKSVTFFSYSMGNNESIETEIRWSLYETMGLN